VRLRPRHWSNHYYLGWALLTAHRIPEAIDPLTKAKDLLSSFESTYVNLGFAHLSLGNWDQAIGNSNLALQRSPKDSSAVTNLATAYYWQRRYGDALANYQKAQDWDPNNAKRYMNLGDTYGALGRRADAHQAYVTAVEKATPNLDDATTAAIAAKCEAKLGNAAKAESLALSAVSTAGNDPDVAYKAAVVFALKPDVDTAMKYLKLAVDNGYSLYFVRDDPDLRSLSNHPQFKSLIAQIGR
jgi:tetratricopeptide (TPR) repeat protein